MDKLSQPQKIRLAIVKLMALVLSQEAIRHPDFNRLPQVRQRFILMPFMHSEATDIHQAALPLFEALGDPANPGI